jgi:hypothetical protein
MISRDTIPFCCGRGFAVDFQVFNVRVLRNENRPHPLNATLRAMVEVAGDQPARATNDEPVVRKST